MENAPVLSRRPLGAFENAQALTAEHHPFNLVAVAALSGPIDAERLREELEALASRYPLLRARVAGRRRRYFEIPGRGPSVELELERRSAPEAWTAVVERELGHRFEPGEGPLVRCVLVSKPGDDDAEIVLGLQHTLLDGVAVTHLVEELLGGLGGAGPVRPAAAADPLPASADERFPAAWRRPRRLARSAAFLGRQMADELTFRWRSRGRHAGPPAAAFRCRVLPLALAPGETETLVRAARRRRVTLTAILEAAMLLAVVGHRYRGVRLPHRYFSFPVLRRYLDPPVPDDVVGCYVTTLRLTTEVSAGDDLWRLASRIHRQLEASMRRGERFLATVWSHWAMKMTFRQRGRRMGTTALSYTGPARLAGRYGRLELRELRAFVSNIPQGPEYTAQARLFGGRLWLDVVYLDADMDEREARAIAETMRGLLTARPGAAGPRPEPAA